MLGSILVIVTGGIFLSFLLNKGDDKSTPTDKSSQSVNKSFSPQQYNDYVTNTQKKIRTAQEAEEECKQEKNPKTGKNYKSCEEKEEAEAVDEEVEKEKVKEEKKSGKQVSAVRLNALRKKAQQKAKQLVSTNRMASRPQGCAKVNKKGECVKCETGLFIDESGDCHGSTAECNYPFHMEHHDPEKKKRQLISNEMAEKLIPTGKARCVCPHIHTDTGTMHKLTNGICQRRVKTKEGKLVYKNFSEEGDVPYYATNEDKLNASNDGILHPDFLKDHNFYQEEEEEENEPEDEANLSLPMDGSFFKVVDRKIVKTKKTDKDKSLSHYAGSGVFCYPNDPKKNTSSLCISNLTFHEGFTITPECVF